MDKCAVTRNERMQSLAELMAEENHLRDIQSQLDMLSSCHPAYNSHLQDELDSLKKFSFHLDNVNHKDLLDHLNYSNFCVDLQKNFDEEKNSEMRARKIFLGAIFGGLSFGILLVFLSCTLYDYLSEDGSEGSSLISYKENILIKDLQYWINCQNNKIAHFMNEIASDLSLRQYISEKKVVESEGECWEEDDKLTEKIEEMVKHNEKVQNDMNLVSEKLKLLSLPVLEVKQEDRDAYGLWMTTFVYSSIAVFLPIIAYISS